MIFGELHRRGARWKFRAVGQGFNGRLAPLAESFGIDIAAALVENPPVPIVAVPLGRIMLNEAGQTITLSPAAEGCGDIVVTLTWSHSQRGYYAEDRPIDLDLGCLVEMQDGRKTAVQALGGMLGSREAPPFVELSGDDRTGEEGERLRIAGQHRSAIKCIAIFANV